ncbi:hypothetical protein QTP86_013744, partial [Hemibagrus guttatus]
MSFLRRVAGRSLRDRVGSSVTREELGVEPLLLHIERGQLRWLGHLFRMPPGRLPGEVFRACPTGKRPRGRPRTRWRDYVFRLAWERLRVPPEELEEVARERERTTSRTYQTTSCKPASNTFFFEALCTISNCCPSLCAGSVRWTATCRSAPLLRATPSRALIDELIALEAHHLPPNSPVTMRAQMTCEDGHLWQSVSHYQTDDDGVIDLTKHPSVGGSYVGCEPMGLFWSLQPGEKEGLRLRKKDVETPYTVDVSVLEGHISPLNSSKDEQIRRKHECELATVSLHRWYMAPGVRRIEIRQNRVVGTLFLPPGPGPFPAVVDLWGLAQGLIEYRAALIASHGLACMTLSYFDHKDLPGPRKRINVGDSYLKAAWQVLCDHPQVCEDRIAIIGISFGVYIALRIATSLSVNPRCVVCINGTFCSINKFFGEDGENINEEQKHWNINDQGCVSFRDFCLPSTVPPENFVQIEKLHCPLLFVIGEDDLCCPTVENADE